MTLPASPEEVREVQIIVNADDLGMSPEVNDAIFGLMARGRVTSASLLAIGSASSCRRAGSVARVEFRGHVAVESVW